MKKNFIKNEKKFYKNEKIFIKNEKFFIKNEKNLNFPTIFSSSKLLQTLNTVLSRDVRSL